MFCTQCGTKATSAEARFCAHCGHVLTITDFHNASITAPAAPALPPIVPHKLRWYEGKRGAIGLGVLSFFIYSWVLLTAFARETLRGNEAIYVVAWTAVLFYALAKRRAWKGWAGSLVGCIAGIAIVLFATVLAGVIR